MAWGVIAALAILLVGLIIVVRDAEQRNR